MQRIFLIKNIYDYNYIEQFLYILPFLGQLRNIILKSLSLDINKHILLSVSCRVIKKTTLYFMTFWLVRYTIYSDCLERGELRYFLTWKITNEITYYMHREQSQVNL